MLFVLQIPSNRHFKISLKISSVLAKCIALPNSKFPRPRSRERSPLLHVKREQMQFDVLKLIKSVVFTESIDLVVSGTQYGSFYQPYQL